ncbi:hypothetical protein COV13_01320 [Candidatus Woesearchaeota archaeon CG10_big_fil_rev_8_21_14_0_10_32_9]|nr:MAG: hypothetical protein COV13_01320 [Candidatus Woesearchaeota archaeon CG10_big_fil_rev_8_21_14_0_10_32_9]
MRGKKMNDKKMKKTTMFGLLAVLVVGIIFSTGLASAYRGDYSIKGPQFNEERHELMETAFENLDYAAWYELMSENGMHPRVLDVVNENNFATFAQAHNAVESGDFVTANNLRTELGLNNGNGPRDGSGQGAHQGLGQGRMQPRQIGNQNCLNN